MKSIEDLGRIYGYILGRNWDTSSIIEKIKANLKSQELELLFSDEDPNDFLDDYSLIEYSCDVDCRDFFEYSVFDYDLITSR